MSMLLYPQGVKLFPISKFCANMALIKKGDQVIGKKKVELMFAEPANIWRKVVDLSIKRPSCLQVFGLVSWNRYLTSPGPRFRCRILFIWNSVCGWYLHHYSKWKESLEIAWQDFASVESFCIEFYSKYFGHVLFVCLFVFFTALFEKQPKAITSVLASNWKCCE